MGGVEGASRKTTRPSAPAFPDFVDARQADQPDARGAGRTALADESLSQVARLLSTAARRLGLSPAAECLNAQA